MRGWLADGTEVELSKVQAEVVRAILLWDLGKEPTAFLPTMGRQGGKTTILATVREYQRRAELGYEELPETHAHVGGMRPSELLKRRLGESGDMTRHMMMNDPVFRAEVERVGIVLDVVGADAQQVGRAFDVIVQPQPLKVPWDSPTADVIGDLRTARQAAWEEGGKPDIGDRM